MQDFTLYDVFRRNARLFGKRTALVWDGGKMTHAALLEEADAVAGGLAGRGLGKGDRVAVLANNHYRFFPLFGAAARLGLVLVPLNWRLSDDEVRFILSDAEPSVLVVDGSHRERAESIAAGSIGEGGIVGFDREAGAPASLDDWTAPGPSEAPAAGGSDPFCLIYTAAVAGRPRGAVLSQSNVVYSNLQTLATLGLGPEDGYLNILPLFHITGLNLALAVLQAGGRNAVVERFDPEEALGWIEAESTSVIGSFPPILSRLLETQESQGRDLSALKHVMGLDAPDVVAQLESATGATFWILYGQTETSGMVTLGPARERPGSAGRQGLITAYRLVDDAGREVAAGEKGEIVVRGPLVFQGFWTRGGGRDTSTFRDGWHHTGDLGSRDADGYLHFGGRKPEKELIKPGGENVYPAEVEAVIRTHPAVADVSVIGVPDPEFGEGVKAVCVLAPGGSVTAAELSEFVASRIARYKKPRYVEFVDRLPKTQAGETDREAVKQRHGAAG
jgi:long-chain acyl-CoA synthetase